MKDHIVIAQHRDTLKWHGLFYVNHPTPSGSPRPILKIETKEGYETQQEALDIIKAAFNAEQLASIDIPNVAA